MLAPGPARAEYEGVRPRVVVTGAGLGGHCWEQLALPFAVWPRHILFSPSGWGPVAHPNQVVTIHDLAPLENPRWYNRGFAAWYAQLVPALARRARNILTVSAFCKRRIIEILRIPEERITVAWEAVGSCFSRRPEAEVQRTLERFGIGRPFFLAVGAISARKNLPRLLRSWDRVADRIDQTALVIVGKRGLRFSDGAGLGALPRRAMHLSSVNDQDLACLYSAAEGLLYPSLYEGFGLPILEAMACDCPVLTSNCTAMPEIAGDAAVLVDPLSEESIAEGILDLTRENTAAEMRCKGSLRCRNFGWDRTAELVEGVLLN